MDEIANQVRQTPSGTAASSSSSIGFMHCPRNGSGSPASMPSLAAASPATRASSVTICLAALSPPSGAGRTLTDHPSSNVASAAAAGAGGASTTPSSPPSAASVAAASSPVVPDRCGTALMTTSGRLRGAIASIE